MYIKFIKSNLFLIYLSSYRRFFSIEFSRMSFNDASKWNSKTIGRRSHTHTIFFLCTIHLSCVKLYEKIDFEVWAVTTVCSPPPPPPSWQFKKIFYTHFVGGGGEQQTEPKILFNQWICCGYLFSLHLPNSQVTYMCKIVFLSWSFLVWLGCIWFKENLREKNGSK